ncbi:MAG: helix-turn-helix domain-containing protein [Ruminococcus sp.]|uniref:helix-turn-helix domain-containing protein n=1 Tax=Ruminococcus sp. TaxID=41978 RepID=UPI0025EDB0B0|nr:helix-turn-helix transcriptional regulator [Ruminococcus sp.]MCR5599163.1 helix-turn-helix domain-containing protein [Ruminococcus sp.]
MEIGNQIKKYRGKLKWSQEVLAEKTFVSRQTVSSWENDKSYPDIHSLLMLSKLFNISLDELVKGDVESMKNEIKKSDNKKFNSLAWLLTGEYILMVLSAVPLMKYLGWLGGVIWGILVSVSLFTALKVEKLKKENNIQTYKEIKAFMEGKPLDEISADRMSSLNKPVIKAAIGAGIALLVCTVMTYLLFR